MTPCIRCKVAKPPEAFRVNKRNRSGRFGFCRACENARKSELRRGTLTPEHLPERSGFTLHEIGLVLGVSRERVRQIEVIALRKLRVALAEMGVK